MLLFKVLFAASAFFASTIALNLSIQPPPAVKRTTTIHSRKVSSTALEKQARNELRLLQLKYSEKIDIQNKATEQNGGGMKKRVGKAASGPPLPPKVSQRQVGITPLTPNNRMIGWSAPYQIYKGKQLKLLFDTGSSLTVSEASERELSRTKESTDKSVC